MIWPFLLFGGGGFEWYSGYQNTCGDLLCEDLRAKAMIFQYSACRARVPAAASAQRDGCRRQPLSPGGKIWFKKAAVYAAYLPNGGTAQLNLTGETGAFRVRFDDVVNGTYSPTTMVTGGEMVSLGVPPFPGDVAVLVER